MATKKTTTFKDRSPSLDDMDFDFNELDFGDTKEEKKLKKRHPIMKVATNVAKGSLGHMTSKSFIRQTLKTALPEGYDVVSDVEYQIKDSASQLYNTAAQEWRKIEPSARRSLQRILPRDKSFLPKGLEQRLRRFADGGIQSGPSRNEDEESIRSAMAELERVGLEERARERAEDNAKENLQKQIDSRRFTANLKALASIDARMARANAFDDQIVSKFQRRSLELQYRQYFTLRDTQKLLGGELSQLRRLMEATVHNTALPDAVKLKMRERVGSSLRERLVNSAPGFISGFTRDYFKNTRQRLETSIKGAFSGFGGALMGAEMGADQLQMMRDMGIDVSAESGKAAGAGIAGLLSDILGRKLKKSFTRSGYTSQKMAKLGRHGINLVDYLADWAGTSTDTSTVKGKLAQLIKDVLPKKSQERRVAGAAILDNGEMGAFTKRFQRSVEEVMPDYLSRILHELSMMRSGKSLTEGQRVVWNDERNRFTTVSDRNSDVNKRVLDNPTMQFSRSQVKDFVDKFTPGAKLSGPARKAFEQQVMHDVLSGQRLDERRYLRGKNLEFMSPEHAAEIRKAIRGSSKTIAGGKNDQVARLERARSWENLRRTIPDQRQMLSAYADNGQLEHLIREGWVKQEGDNFTMDYAAMVRAQRGHTLEPERVSPYSKENSNWVEGDSDASMMERFRDVRTDLYRPGQLDQPVVVGSKIAAGIYRSAKTGKPIRLMRQVLEGVVVGNKIITPDQVRKLQTASGESITDFLARTKPAEPTGRLARTYKKANDFSTNYLGNAGAHIDNLLEGKVDPAIRRLRNKWRKKAKNAQAWRADMSEKAGQKYDAIEAAAERAMTPGTVENAQVRAAASSVVSMAGESLSQMKQKSAPWRAAAVKRLESLWKRAMGATQYAADLYRSGELVPVIKAEALRAGDYISAKTGKPIKDIRQLIEGVRDRSGQWIATPNEVIQELRLKSGERFTDMVTKAQEALAHAKATPSGQKAATVLETAVEKIHAAAAVKPVITGPTSSLTDEVAKSPSSSTWDMGPIQELINAFKDGNFERLEAIATLLQNGGSFGGNGSPASPSTKSTGGKDSWLKRFFKGGRRVAGTAARGYGSYVRTVFGLPFKAIAGLGRAGSSLGHELTKTRTHLGSIAEDVFVVGEHNPRLTKGAMQAGVYFNTDEKGNLTTPVLAPDQIKGVIKDADGQTVLTAEDIKKGITDFRGRSILNKAVLGAMGVVGRIAGGIGGFYGGLFRMAGATLQWGANQLKEGMFGRRIIEDVYTSDDLEHPKLFATGMRSGIYVSVKNPRNVIRSVNDIDGPVRSISDHGNIVLSAEDIAKGLVNLKGKSFPVGKKNLLGTLGGAAGSLAGTFIKGYGQLIGHMARAGFAVASLPFRAVARLFGGKRHTKGGMFRMNARAYKDVPIADQITHRLLTQIGELLDQRLPETEHARAGSWQEILKRHAAERAASKNKKSTDDKSQGSLWGKLFDLFHRKDNDDDDHDGSGNSYDFGGEDRTHDAKGRTRGGWRRNAEARRIRKLRAKGFRGKALEEELAKGGKFKRLMTKIGGSRIGKFGSRIAESRVGRIAGMVGRGVGATGRFGGRMIGGLARGVGKLPMLGRVAGMGGRILKGAAGGIGGLLGGMALDAYASGHQGTMSGKLAGYGSTALNVLGGAQAVSSILGGGSVLGAVGSGLATAGSAVATGIGAAASAIGAVLSAPVLLGAAAVAAIGTAAYFGYKYYSLKKKAPFRKLRMAQYGVDMDKGVWKVDKIQKLEAMLMKHVRINGATASIDPKGLDETEILKLFDLARSWYNPMRWFHTKNAADLQNNKAFFAWLGSRFRPVFLKWMQSLHQIAPTVELSDVDDKLSKEQKQALLTSVTTVDASIYNVAASPFADDPVVTGTAVVDKNVAEIKKELGDKKPGEKPGVKGGVPTITKKPGSPTAPGPKKPGDVTKLAATAAIAAAMKNTTGKGASSKSNLSASSGLNFTNAYLGGKVSALTAVRYKTYGITDMDPERVKALYLLENDILTKVTYDGHGNAEFNEDVGFYFKEYAGYFGVSTTDEKAKLRWYGWFAKRFLPTLLQFATAVKQANKAIDPRDAEDRLAPQHILDVANLTAAAVFKGTIVNASVWTFTESPFDDKPLNSDSTVIKENIQALKDAVQKRKLQEQKAKLQESKNKDSLQNAANQSNQANQVKTEAAVRAGQKASLTLPPGVEAGSAAADRFAQTGSIAQPMGETIKQPGNGTGGDINKLPNPSGRGKDAIMPVLDAAGKMAGIDPGVLSTFAGLESGFDPNAHAPTSSAAGLFQFIQSTWKTMLARYGSKYGIDPRTPPTDARAAALMGAEYIKENQRQLAKALGRQPTDSELYLAHFLGPAGAISMLKADPTAIGAAINPKAASANTPIFYRRGQALSVAAVLKVINDRVARFRPTGKDLAAAKAPLEAPSTGGNTTTTANGLKGGVGAQEIAAFPTRNAAQTDASGNGAPSVGAKSLAALTPGPSPRVPVGIPPQADAPVDVVAVGQARYQRKAEQANRQAQVTAQVQQSQMNGVSGLLQQQLSTQQSMLDALQKMLEHTGVLPKIAEASEKSDSSSGLSSSDPAKATPSRQPNSAAPMSQVPVSMRATKYG